MKGLIRQSTGPSFEIQRRDLLAGVLALVRPFGLSNPSNEVLMRLLIYSNKDFPDEIIEIALS